MDDLSTIRSEALGAVQQAADLAALEVARVAALGKKGSVTGLMKTLGTLAPEQRKEFGARVNQLKGEIEAALEARKSTLGTAALAARLASEKVDVTLPVRPETRGTLHPIGEVMDELASIFGEMGFTWAEGPDIEDDWHNFSALNIPPDAIVETELPFFAEFHDTGGGETLRMRRHAEAMTRRERYSADEIGVPEGPLEDHPTIVNDRDHAARLRGVARLVFEPAWDVIERGLQPFVHGFVRKDVTTPRGRAAVGSSRHS